MERATRFGTCTVKPDDCAGIIVSCSCSLPNDAARGRHDPRRDPLARDPSFVLFFEERKEEKERRNKKKRIRDKKAAYIKPWPGEVSNF